MVKRADRALATVLSEMLRVKFAVSLRLEMPAMRMELPSGDMVALSPWGKLPLVMLK